MEPFSDAWYRAAGAYARVVGWRPMNDWCDYMLASVLLEFLPNGDERAVVLRLVIADALSSMGEDGFEEWGR